VYGVLPIGYPFIDVDKAIIQTLVSIEKIRESLWVTILRRTRWLVDNLETWLADPVIPIAATKQWCVSLFTAIAFFIIGH
jgi:hypothetical protein